MKYVKFDLDRSSLAYIKEILAAGNTLARMLAERRDVDAGTVWAYLPEESVSFTIANYSYDNGTSRNTSLNYLASYIADFLKSERSICILENRYARKGDPHVNKYRSAVIYYCKEIYHIVKGSEVSSDSIETAIREADTSMFLVGVCAIVPDQFDFSPMSDISTNAIERIAQSAVCFFVEAFDGGGFLIWEGADAGGIVSLRK